MSNKIKVIVAVMLFVVFVVLAVVYARNISQFISSLAEYIVVKMLMFGD